MSVTRARAAGGKRRATGVGAFETGIRRGVRSLAEDSLDPGDIEIRVERGAWRSGHAVRRPRVQIVRCAGEMGTGIDVVITRGDHVVVLGGMAVQVGTDAPGDLRPACHRQRAAFAEVVLHVDDDESAHGPTVSRPSPRQPAPGARSGGPRPDQPPTSAAQPPVMRASSLNDVGNTVCGWPAAAQTTLYLPSHTSTSVRILLG